MAWAEPTGDSPTPPSLGQQLPAETPSPKHSGTESAPHVSVEDFRDSGFSWLSKIRVPLATFGQAFAISSLLYVPNIYISLFSGDAKLIGLANIIVVPYEIAVNPYVGWLSDAGSFNRCVFKDVDCWGRRAPLMIWALPMCIISTFLFWVGPESLASPVSVAIWYTILRFSLTTGHSMFEVSFQAAFTELFPSKSERANLGLVKFAVGIVAGGAGTIGVGTTALGINKPGTSSQRNLFAIFGVLTACTWLLAIPYALLQRKSLMKKTAHGSVWSGMSELWCSSAAFRCFAISSHFYSAGFALTISALPFYLEAVLGFNSDQVSSSMRILFLGGGITVFLSFPVISCVGSRLDPSKVSGFSGLACVMVGICHAHASSALQGKFWPQVIQIAVICGAGVGLLSVSWAAAQSAMFTWIVDDDQVRSADRDGILGKERLSMQEVPARRDGMINAFKACFTTAGIAWTGLLQLFLGIFGYDGDRFSNGEAQPEKVARMLDILFIAIIPLMFIVGFGVPMLCFPLRGARPQDMVRNYHKLYDRIASEGNPIGASH